MQPKDPEPTMRFHFWKLTSRVLWASSKVLVWEPFSLLEYRDACVGGSAIGGKSFGRLQTLPASKGDAKTSCLPRL